MWLFVNTLVVLLVVLLVVVMFVECVEMFINGRRIIMVLILVEGVVLIVVGVVDNDNDVW